MKTAVKKLSIVAFVVGLIALFQFLHLGDYLSFSYLKGSKEQLELLYSRHTVAVAVSYMIIYILVTSMSLPGAAVMTLAGGALFGLMTGTVIVSFASSIGATLACFVSRYVLRDWVQGRFGTRLKAINQGIEREGAFYLFTLRLIPIFPFWLINLLMGLTAIRLVTFYWVSQIGMLPATLIYVNAGKQLSEISSPSEILSPALILSLALLGLFPIAAKKLLNFYKERYRVHQKTDSAQNVDNKKSRR